MTRYFDSANERLCEIGDKVKIYLVATAAHERGDVAEPAYYAFDQAAREVERQVLHDCQLCSTLPEFPADLRDEMQVIIARHGTEAMDGLYADDEDEAATLKRMHDLVWDLHTLFHTLAQRRLGLSDNPDSILHVRVNILQERRLELMRGLPEFSIVVKKYDSMMERCREELQRP